MNKKYILVFAEINFLTDIAEEFDEVEIKILKEKFQDFKIIVHATNALEAHAKARKEFQEVFITEFQDSVKNIKKYNFILKIVSVEVDS